MEHRDASNAGSAGGVFEGAFLVVKNGVLLVAERADENVRPTIVVVVGKIDTHPGETAAVFVVGDALFQAHFLKAALPEIMEELLGPVVVGDDDIRPTVAVVIVKCDAETVSRGGANSGLLRSVCKRSVAVVAVGQVRHLPELVWVAVGTS